MAPTAVAVPGAMAAHATWARCLASCHTLQHMAMSSTHSFATSSSRCGAGLLAVQQFPMASSSSSMQTSCQAAGSPFVLAQQAWRSNIPFRTFATAPLVHNNNNHDHHHQEEGSRTRASTSSSSSSSMRKSFEHGYVAPHPGLKTEVEHKEAFMSSPTYDHEYLESVRPTHLQPQQLHQWTGYYAVQLMRGSFDWLTGYGPAMDEKKWLRRIIFLEAVAGVPGMVGGMLRHLKSLRSMQKDHGWIHTLLQEAENERMHLLTFMNYAQPSLMLRAAVLLTQGVFFNLFFLAYLLSPKHCHAFVGYLEEEAVKTYTHCLEDIDAGKLWPNQLAPPMAVDYWKMAPGATMRDLILAVRADEACHAHVNHTFGKMKGTEYNPFAEDEGSMKP